MIRFELEEVHETIDRRRYDGWAVNRYVDDVRDQRFCFFAKERGNAEKSLASRRQQLADGTAAAKAAASAAKKAGGVWCKECDRYHPPPKSKAEHTAIGCQKPWQHDEVA